MIAYKRILVLFALIMVLSIFIATQINILIGLLVLAISYWLFIGLPYIFQKKGYLFGIYWSFLTKGGKIGPKN